MRPNLSMRQQTSIGVSSRWRKTSRTCSALSSSKRWYCSNSSAMSPSICAVERKCSSTMARTCSARIRALSFAKSSRYSPFTASLSSMARLQRVKNGTSKSLRSILPRSRSGYESRENVFCVSSRFLRQHTAHWLHPVQTFSAARPYTCGRSAAAVVSSFSEMRSTESDALRMASAVYRRRKITFFLRESPGSLSPCAVNKLESRRLCGKSMYKMEAAATSTAP